MPDYVHDECLNAGVDNACSQCYIAVMEAFEKIYGGTPGPATARTAIEINNRKDEFGY